MEILRVQPYADIVVSIDIPEDYINTDLSVTVTDLADLSVILEQVQNATSDQISLSLPGQYDSDYKVDVYLEDGSFVATETFELRRPYVDPNTKGTTLSEIQEYKKHEELARAIIDSVVPSGFYYNKKTLEVSGNGSDYMPLWNSAIKVLAVYENNTLVTDRTFGITKDKSSIVENYSGTLNRNESAPVTLLGSPSDYFEYGISDAKGFAKNFDYRIVIEQGYTKVPSDIVRATELLVDDISCGKLDYYQRYITGYNTDQFRIQFDKKSFEGTGNLIVDKILSKYSRSISKIGVL